MSFGAFGWLVGNTERFKIIHSDLDFSMRPSHTNVTIDNINDVGSFYGSQNIVHSFDPTSKAIVSSDSSHDMSYNNGRTLIDESLPSWQSGVKLVECRYLAQSGCKALCLHLCKAPTQQFFLQELGVPLYMKPDFKTNSCEMMFGVMPPSEAMDPAFQEACFTSCFNNFKNKTANSHAATTNTFKLRMLQNTSSSLPHQITSNITTAIL